MWCVTSSSSRRTPSRRHVRTRTEVTSSSFFPLYRICYDAYQLVGPHKRLLARRRVISAELKVEYYRCHSNRRVSRIDGRDWLYDEGRPRTAFMSVLSMSMSRVRGQRRRGQVRARVFARSHLFYVSKTCDVASLLTF